MNGANMNTAIMNGANMSTAIMSTARLGHRQVGAECRQYIDQSILIKLMCKTGQRSCLAVDAGVIGWYGKNPFANAERFERPKERGAQISLAQQGLGRTGGKQKTHFNLKSAGVRAFSDQC